MYKYAAEEEAAKFGKHPDQQEDAPRGRGVEMRMPGGIVGHKPMRQQKSGLWVPK